MPPTLEHNGFVEMFRENPALAPHFLDILFHIDVPPHTSVAVVESALDQLMPIEFRADLVLELKDANGDNVLAIILEVQRDKDPDKKFSWAAYVAVVYARKRCPTIVLVVAPDDDVATWAADPIDMGLGRGIVAPLVLGPKVVPEVTEEAQAEQEKELAVLSAVAHGNGPNGPAVLMAAIAGLERLDREHAAAYFQIVYNVLREPMRRALEKLIMQRQTEAKAPLPPFIQQFVDGGKLEGQRSSLLRLLSRAGIALSESDRARIVSCTDPGLLDHWLDNVIGAKTAADVFS
ncbi:MAG: hypothetical protein QM820_12630 [Minicystis sp.]